MKTFNFIVALVLIIAALCMSCTYNYGPAPARTTTYSVYGYGSYHSPYYHYGYYSYPYYCHY